MDEREKQFRFKQMQLRLQRERAAASAAPSQGSPDTEQMRGHRHRDSGMANGLRSVFQGVTLGAGDEMVGAVTGAVDSLRGGGPLSQTVPRRIEEERKLIEGFRKSSPKTAFATEVGGALAVPMGAAARGASLAGQSVRGAAVGGATGAAYGFNAAEGGVAERGKAALPSAGFGAAAGAAAPAVLRGVQGAIDGRANNRVLDAAAAAAPKVDDLRAQSSGLYERARQRGVVVREDAFAPLVQDMARTAAELGVDRDVTPAAAAALRRFTTKAMDAAETGQGISFNDIDILRRVATNASTSNNPQDRMIAGHLVEMTDNFVANLMDSDLDAGVAQGLSEELSKARSLWKQMRNSEMLGRAIEEARDQASGFENGIRIKFREIIRNKKVFRSLSDGEKEAVRQVVRGTNTGNMLKRMSKMGFGRGAQTNVLGGMVGGSMGGGVGATIGSAVAGPPGAAIGAGLGSLAAAGVGAIGARGAEKSTLRLAERARAISAGGGIPTMPPPTDMMLLENALGRIARYGVPSAVSQ